MFTHGALGPRADEFDPNRFEPIENRPPYWVSSKPSGGLWASPVAASLSWRTHQSGGPENEAAWGAHWHSFNFALTDDARVLSFATAEDLDDYSFPLIDSEYVDWEKLAEEFDAILIDESAVGSYTFGDEEGLLTGWDVESLLVFNPNVIIPIADVA